MLRSSPEFQEPQFVVDAHVFLHLQRLLLAPRRTVAATSSTIEPLKFPVPHNPRNVGSNDRVWMNSVHLSHVTALVRPPAQHRQEANVSLSYPVSWIRVNIAPAGPGPSPPGAAGP